MSRSIPFVKASACGNDFLLVELSAVEPCTPGELADITKRICDRHEGVGADGVEWMLQHLASDIEIRLINADGSDAEVSGNGTRCVAAYLCSETKKEKLAIQTGAGLKTCKLITRRDNEYEFEAEMGEATVDREVKLITTRGEIRGIPVSMGNPHYVIFVSEFPPQWQLFAAEIQQNTFFRQGVNVEFVKVEDESNLQVRFFERGAGETQSSGTGSCASAAAAIATARTASPVEIHTPGGLQTVRQESRRIFLRGAARLVCRGEFFIS